MLSKLLFLLFLVSATSFADRNNIECTFDADSVIALTICLDDDVKVLEHLRNRIENNVLNRIEIRYGKKDPTRAKHLKSRFQNSVHVWYQYRMSFCEMESISVSAEDNQGDFVKQCLISISKNRIEDLRLMQINI